MLQEREHLFRGTRVHYLELGAHGSPPLLLLHGSGPGASTTGNWRKILEPLGEQFHVHAMDLVGFGKSGPKEELPYFDYPFWMAQCRDMLSRIPGERVGVIGHSLSGSFALRLGASEERVHKVMTTATLGAPFKVNATTCATWSYPHDRNELMSIAQKLIHDSALIDGEYLAHRASILFTDADYARYFSAMFDGDKQRFIDQATLTSEEIAGLRCEVLLVHGRNDEGYPAEALSLALASAIPQADVVLLGNCSHSIAFEQPEKFLALARAFFAARGPLQ